MSNTKSKGSKRKKTSGQQIVMQESYESKKYAEDFKWGNGQFEKLERSKIDVVQELAKRLEKTGLIRTQISTAILHMCKKYISRAWLSLILGDDFKDPRYIHKKNPDQITEKVGTTTEEDSEPTVIDNREERDVFEENGKLMKKNMQLELELKLAKAAKTVTLDKGWIRIPRAEFEHMMSIMRAEPKLGSGVFIHFNPDHEMDQVLPSEVFERQYKSKELKDVVYN